MVSSGLPEYFPGFRAEAGVADEVVDLFFDFFLAEFAMAAAMEDSVVVVFGFFFAGELEGEASFASFIDRSLSVRSFGLFISLMMWLISSLS